MWADAESRFGDAARRMDGKPTGGRAMVLRVVTALALSIAAGGAVGAPCLEPPDTHTTTPGSKCSTCHAFCETLGADRTEEAPPSGGINAGCLSCHDGKPGVPDVVGHDVNGLFDRAAGAFAPPGTASVMGHDLALGFTPSPHESPAQARDRAASLGLVCTDCHTPFRNGAPANLRSASGARAQLPLGLFRDPLSPGLLRYEAGNVSYGAASDGMIVAPSARCLDCHQDAIGRNRHPSFDLHGVQAAGTPRLTPVSLADRTGRSPWVRGVGAGFEAGRLRFLAVDAASHAAATRVSTTGNLPFCFTCHKAHGSTHPDALVFDPDAGPSPCLQCHAVGPASKSMLLASR